MIIGAMRLAHQFDLEVLNGQGKGVRVSICPKGEPVPLVRRVRKGQCARSTIFAAPFLLMNSNLRAARSLGAETNSVFAHISNSLETGLS